MPLGTSIGIRRLFLLPIALIAAPSARGETPFFDRGDPNDDGAFDLADAVHTLGFLFLGTPASIGCEDAADTNDDGTIDIADPVHSLGFLFLGGPPPPSPFGVCGRDDTDDALGCETFSRCLRVEPRFEEVARYEMDRCQPVSVAFGDLDRDGTLDLVAAGWTTGCVWAFLGNGDGSFGEPFRASGGTGFHIGFKSIVLGDFDENGVLDLALASSDGPGDLSMFLGMGDGRFEAGPTQSLGNPVSLAAGDLNRDGHLDLAVASTALGVSVLFGTGEGTFNEPVGYPLSSSLSIAAGDLNGDGVLDLAATTATRELERLAIFIGLGDGSFDEPVLYEGTGSHPNTVALEDLNGDGSLDAVVGDWATGDVSVFLGAEDGTFGAAAACATGWPAPEVALGDLDRNGAPDLAVARQRDNSVSILFGTGDGDFVRGASYAVGDGPFAVAIGDINGDGAPDLAVANRKSNDISILIARPGNVHDAE